MRRFVIKTLKEREILTNITTLELKTEGIKSGMFNGCLLPIQSIASTIYLSVKAKNSCTRKIRTSMLYMRSGLLQQMVMKIIFREVERNAKQNHISVRSYIVSLLYRATTQSTSSTTQQRYYFSYSYYKQQHQSSIPRMYLCGNTNYDLRSNLWTSLHTRNTQKSAQTLWQPQHRAVDVIDNVVMYQSTWQYLFTVAIIAHKKIE